VVTDKALLAIVRQQIRTKPELDQSGLLSTKKIRRYGTPICKCIENGRSVKGNDRPELKRPIRLSTKEKEAYERLTSFVQLKCDMQGIDPQLIGTTAELRQLAKNLNIPGSPLPPRLTGGWRKGFLDEFFRQRM
jgi:ribonuclease D